jgi:hypothetical protein
VVLEIPNRGRTKPADPNPDGPRMNAGLAIEHRIDEAAQAT